MYSDSDRQWPGDGDIGLETIFRNLKSIGYDGLVSVELFNPDYYLWPVDDVFAAAIRTTKSFLNRIW